jgi:hypothetical protein
MLELLQRAHPTPRSELMLGAWPEVSKWKRLCAVTLEIAADEGPISWRRLKLLGDFVVGDAGAGRDALRYDVAAVATELLENALHNRVAEEPRVKLTITRYRGTIGIECQNRASWLSVERLEETFAQLAVESPEDLMCSTILRMAAVRPSESGIGLSKLRVDHDLGLGALVVGARDLEPEAGLAEVTVRALLDVAGARR